MQIKKPVVLIITTLMLTAMIVPLIKADTTGWNPPGLDDYQTTQWNNANNARSDDGNLVDTTNPGNAVNYYGFDFAVPAGSTIIGIQVQLVDAACSVTGRSLDVSLSYDNGNHWTGVKNTGSLSSTAKTIDFGGDHADPSSDNWGYASWTPDIINSDNFLVKIKPAGGGSGDPAWSFDYLPVRITYTPPAASDITAPLVTVNVPTPDGSNGWFVTKPVTVSITAEDDSNVVEILVNDVAIPEVDITGLGTTTATASYDISAEGTTEITARATDGAGNTGAAEGSSNTATIKIDTVAPTLDLDWPDGPYVLGQPGLVVTWTASDATPGSGLASDASGSFSIDTTAVGSKPYSVVAPTDVAGNIGTGASGDYDVVYSILFGHEILQPLEQVNNPGELTKAYKSGRTLPIKFQLCDYYGNPVGPASTLPTLAMRFLGTISDPSDETVDVDASGASNTGNTFRYDTTEQQYIFNLSTKGYGLGTYQITATLDDASTIVTYFQLTK
jgi:hypothetical protein